MGCRWMENKSVGQNIFSVFHRGTQNGDHAPSFEHSKTEWIIIILVIDTSTSYIGEINATKLVTIGGGQ